MAATAVVVFPYLTGSNSPAFRGISVFLGVLLPLCSGSAVSHGVAGTILTYMRMRSFSVGDFVRIGDSRGSRGKKIFWSRASAHKKQEIVTIPNGSVLGGVVTNYTAEALKKRSHLVHPPFDRIQRPVEEGARTADQRCFVDGRHSAVAASFRPGIQSGRPLRIVRAERLHCQATEQAAEENIQAHFNEAGIEINSPHYTSLRDGNRIAIPEITYRPATPNPALDFGRSTGPRCLPKRPNG
jgi:hypothetical protein